MEKLIIINEFDPQEISDPCGLFFQLGGVHDGRILEFSWKFNSRSMEILVDDLYSNFLDLPEYPGISPARIVFNDLSKLRSDVDMDEIHLAIDSIECKNRGGDGLHSLSILMGVSGSIEITCKSILVIIQKKGGNN